MTAKRNHYRHTGAYPVVVSGPGFSVDAEPGQVLELPLAKDEVPGVLEPSDVKTADVSAPTPKGA